jgi:uncharacterized small protein (DUF1192 family)
MFEELINDLRNEEENHRDWIDSADAIQDIYEDCNLAVTAIELLNTENARLRAELAKMTESHARLSEVYDDLFDGTKRLTAELERTKAERDTAEKDMATIMLNHQFCRICKHDGKCKDFPGCKEHKYRSFEWRGQQQKEDTTCR